MAIPAIPSNLVVQQGNGQVFLSWDLTAGATGYPVQRSLDNVSFSTLATPVANEYLDTAVTTGVQYFYRVASSNGSGTSGNTSAQGIVPTLTGSMSLGQLRLLAQQEADRVNSQFVTKAEWNTYINQSAFELYDMLTTVYEDYNVQGPVLFQTDGSTNQYTLPNGQNSFMDSLGNAIVPSAFYKLTGADCGLGLSNNAWVTLKDFNFIDRNNYVYPNITSTFFGVFNLRYRVVGNTLMLIPTPSAGQYIRIFYVPRLSWLLKDTDVLDGVSGWTEYVVVDAAIKALIKEESDTSALEARKEMLRQRIEASAQNRDAGQPQTISATRGWSGGDGMGGGGNGSFGGI